MARRKVVGRPINGWLVVDKTPGMTSTQVVNEVKRMTQAQKVGHGGTRRTPEGPSSGGP
jgi:tRNA pseudouridine55 synthase